MGRGKKRADSGAVRARAVDRLGGIPLPQPRSEERADIDRLFRRMFEIALSQERRYEALEGSDLATPAFCEYFAAKLIEAHVVNRYRVEGRHFESLLAGALRSAGRQAKLARLRNNAGHDLVVDGERLQLKTEAAHRIDPDLITISKLMESAGTKAVATRADAVRFLPRIVEHLSRYDRIVVLRAFDQPADGVRGVRYELTEIPKTLFAELSTVGWRRFSAPTATGQTRAPLYVPGDEHPALTLVFDGSDNKITLRGVRKDLCQVHATFWVPYGEEIVRGAGADVLAFEDVPERP